MNAANFVLIFIGFFAVVYVIIEIAIKYNKEESTLKKASVVIDDWSDYEKTGTWHTYHPRKKLTGHWKEDLPGGRISFYEGSGFKKVKREVNLTDAKIYQDRVTGVTRYEIGKLNLDVKSLVNEKKRLLADVHRLESEVSELGVKLKTERRIRKELVDTDVKMVVKHGAFFGHEKKK